MTDQDRELLQLDVGDWVRVETPGRHLIEGRVLRCDSVVVIYNDPMACPETTEPAGPITLIWERLRNSAVTRSLTR